MSAIKLDGLCKEFATYEIQPGILGALKGLFVRRKKVVNAIMDLSLNIARGERVAFIGPNGAGKSTTIKMMTGILYPTSGKASILGLTPWKDRTKLGLQIGCVFGQRSQLWYHLPPSDTFSLLAKIYEIPQNSFKKRLHDLCNTFEIDELLYKPVRQLSLGERMRCELVASLLHHPKILFLDEPTIGLDTIAKLKIRSLLNHFSKELGTTLFLTSHDTADIEQVCDRVIVLDKGMIILDETVRELRRTFLKKKRLTLTCDKERIDLSLPGLEVIENANYHFTCEVDLSKSSIDKVIHEALSKAALKDVTIEDPSMEEIIKNLYERRRE